VIGSRTRTTVNTDTEKAPTRAETQIGALPDGGRGGFRTPDAHLLDLLYSDNSFAELQRCPLLSPRFTRISRAIVGRKWAKCGTRLNSPNRVSIG